jgi:putative methyltransferase (TIGR04325 family)
VTPPRPEWQYVPEGFARAVRGWDVDAIERAYRRRWPEFEAAVGGGGMLGIAHEVPTEQAVVTDDPWWQSVIVTFGYVLARAAVGRSRVSLLDWGGGPGHYRLLAAALLPEIELEYHARDLPRLAALGRELQPGAVFHDDDRCLDRTYDVVLASDSLHYVEDVPALVQRLASAAAPWLFAALVPVALTAPSFVVQQAPDAYGYETEYLGWVLNRDELLASAREAGLVLEREFLAPGAIAADGAPEAAVHRSFLFRRG